ncbi:Translin-associated factor X-interacting protein 1, partial [Ophiophagus hannah]
MRLCLPLAHLQEKICTLESVNGVLVTASDQCTQQILAFQQQEKIEIAKLKEERLYLLKLIDKMKEEKCSLETQAKKQDKKRGTWSNSRGICDCNDQAGRNQVAKLRKTLAEEYLRYLNECDARKLLLLDLNEIRDFELQEQKYNDLANKLSTLQKDFDDLRDEYEIMLDIHKQVAEDRDRYFNDLIN